MTAPLTPLGTLLPAPARRGPSRYVTQTTVGNQTYGTTRVLGMWVPAEAFRIGTLIMITGNAQTASTALEFNIGGPGHVRAGGFNIALTALPAVASGFRISIQQETDGRIVNFRTSGFSAGSTSGVQTTSLSGVFIQPLNFIELSTNGSFALDNVAMELFTPQRTRYKSHHELLSI